MLVAERAPATDQRQTQSHRPQPRGRNRSERQHLRASARPCLGAPTISASQTRCASPPCCQATLSPPTLDTKVPVLTSPRNANTGKKFLSPGSSASTMPLHPSAGSHEQAIAHIKNWRILHNDCRLPIATTKRTKQTLTKLFFYRNPRITFIVENLQTGALSDLRLERSAANRSPASSTSLTCDKVLCMVEQSPQQCHRNGIQHQPPHSEKRHISKQG
ncbi:hypothetical protein CCANI_03505 [Corynebacterium canis]|nr:hypothetical protein CCANI_03505 [Corynebacterium canis]